MRTHRLTQIEQLLRDHGECSVEFLSGELAVSDMTIRRDLQRLAQRGRIVRNHGGATATEEVLFEFQFLNRFQHHREQKDRIGELAASLIEDGQSVMLDSGTTTLSLARHLLKRWGLAVITTSLPIAAALQQAAGVETILLGGMVRRDAPDLGGPLTESNLESLRADLAFVGADGIGTDGELYNSSMSVGRMLGKMVSRANAVYVVADSSKIGRTALSRFGNARDFQGLITDSAIAPADLTALRQAGVRILLADKPSVESSGKKDSES